MASSKNTVANSLESLTEIRDMARELVDKIREVRRQENALYVESDSPARANIVTHLDLAQNSARSALNNLDITLDAL
jgi:hypothetical protein